MILQTIRGINDAKAQTAFKYSMNVTSLEHVMTNGMGIVLRHAVTGNRYLVTKEDIIKL